MNSSDYKSINAEIKNDEIIPFYLLKDCIDYQKTNNESDAQYLLDYYRVNGDLSYNYLLKLKINEEDYHETFREIKFSLSNCQLKEASKKLNKNEFEREKDFIESISNRMFLKILNNLKAIIFSNNTDNSKRSQIENYINLLFGIYNDIHDMIFFPTIVANLTYSYNKLIFDCVSDLKLFVKERKKRDLFMNEKEECNNIIIDNKKKNEDYIDYTNNQKFMEAFINLWEFLKFFYKVFEIISE